MLLLAIGINGCSSDSIVGSWEFTIHLPKEEFTGTMKLRKENSSYSGVLISFDRGDIELSNIHLTGEKLTCNFRMRGSEYVVNGNFQANSFQGIVLFDNKEFTMVANRLKEPLQPYITPEVNYILSDEDVKDTEANIDHSGLIDAFNLDGYERGEMIYNSNCITCHGNEDFEGSIPMSRKFWSQPLKAGFDPFSIYQTLTKGVGSMPAQMILTPQQKYDVIVYIREKFIKKNNEDQYFIVTPGYLTQLPKGTSKGPDAKPYHPWSDMDYGNFFINTYELADEKTGIKRYHSPRPAPFKDEDYRMNNFAYKGIAIRLDEGVGGVSKGKAWMIFDHDVMRVAGGWTGDGFIDWEGILLNDQHETYPRTIGQLHFETPVGPGWANPTSGSFEDPRFTARDGRKFGPLPKQWANYKGLYHNGENIVISYTIGNSPILEMLGIENNDGQKVFTRTLNITPSRDILKMRVARAGTQVALSGKGASLKEENGYVVLEIPSLTKTAIKIFIAEHAAKNLSDFTSKSPDPEWLEQYTKGGAPHYPEALTTHVITGNADGSFAVDQLTAPYDNPWKSRIKFSGIDFMKNPDVAVMCTTDGDVWRVTGLTDTNGDLRWQRIASGLFQPLGIKVLDEKIYVTCRDQLVLLRDLNGDGETDYYESFNHDHQVTDHFHEFAMGLQADKEGNLYYAKSGRHAREALIPQHGTLLKVSKDGSKTEIIARGFRAANGVCINPDGSFIVTDQQGYWNPMNRVNWIEGKGKFYGNMWGYNPPGDSTDTGMEPPMVWIDMEFDRSPSELLWVDSKNWGPLTGKLLSFSYGFGKIQLVLNEEVNGQRQGGVIDLPGVKFRSGVMRGRFNPQDGHLYACGMSAWGTSQTMRGGDFYRLRYTNKPLSLPVELGAEENGIKLSFASELDKEKSIDTSNYEVQTWSIVRSRKYGSERYNTQTHKVEKVILSQDGKTVKLVIPEILPVDVMTVSYTILDSKGNKFTGKVQNTIHNLGKSSKIDQATIIQ
ncbi:MAG: c-type cytochrome [Cyclobacteriaceae bacterium]|nr:c-type cytochrome [Cyclobacteriaceae bacterium]